MRSAFTPQPASHRPRAMAFRAAALVSDSITVAFTGGGRTVNPQVEQFHTVH